MPESSTITFLPEQLVQKDKELRSVARRLESITGRKVYYTLGGIKRTGADGKTGTARGAITPDGIYLRCDDDSASVTQLAGHELYHYYEEQFPGLHDRVRQRITERYSEEKFREVAGRYAEKLGRLNGMAEDMDAESYEAMLRRIESEIFADAFGNINYFRLGADRYTEAARETVNETVGSETAAATARRTGPPDEQKFSIDEQFEDKVQKWYATTNEKDRMVSHGYFTVGETSDVLRSIGVREGKIYWRKYKIGEILDKHPEVDINTIKKVPELLEKPLVILKSTTEDDAIVLFGYLRAKNNDPVMASVELTPKAGGSMEAKFSLLTSAYSRSKENIQQLLEKSEFLYLNKTGAMSWLMQLGVKYPSGQPSLGSIGNIAYTDSGVKIKGKTLKEMGGEIRREYNRTALLSEGTVDRWLKDYASKSNPKYAQAYITRMSPDQFLKLTSSRTGRLTISSQTGPMDAEQLIKSTQEQPLQLIIRDGEVVGHEGRHRVTALSRANVQSIPVLVFDSSNKYSKADVSKMVLQGQDFGSSRSYDRVTLENLTPLSYENRDKIVQDYGTQPVLERYREKREGKNTIRFSMDDTADSDYMAAVERGDTETAQRMVDEAAKKAGYTRRMWHGAKKGKNFTVFRGWSYFTENQKYAERYTDQNPENLYGVYAKIEHPFDTRTDRQARRDF